MIEVIFVNVVVVVADVHPDDFDPLVVESRFGEVYHFFGFVGNHEFSEGW